MRRIIVLASLVSLLVGLAPLSASADFPYYTQFRDASGITVKAPSVVDPRALDAAVQVVEQMLRGRDDIRGRLVQQEAALAIIPRDSFVTELPEFAWLSGQIDRNGNAYDSFAIRGLGAVRGDDLLNAAMCRCSKITNVPDEAKATREPQSPTVARRRR